MSRGIFVYRNLRKPGVVWSIKSNRTGRVLARSEYVMVDNAELKVSQAGRNRVLKNKRRNVHAGIKGTWVRGDFNLYVKDWRAFGGIYDDFGNEIRWVRIAYNPYKNDSFVRLDTGKAVHKAERVILSSDGAWALGVE